MTQACTDLFERSNLGTDTSVGKNESCVGRTPDLRNLFRAVWPKKTAVFLAAHTDLTIRQAERILSGEIGLSGGVLCSLLNSEIGIDVLRALMKQTPRWWKEFAVEREITEARRDELRAQRRRKELEARAS